MSVNIAGHMYVCICNALRDKDIAAASSGARSVSEVFKRCGRRPQCGKCLHDVAESIEKQRSTHAPSQALAAQ